MRQKRARDDEEPFDSTSTDKRYCEAAGPSDRTDEVDVEGGVKPIELLEFELGQDQLNVQEIGRIIADGMLEKSLNDEILNELIRNMAKRVPSLANIDLFTLSDDLSRGSIDSRLVIIGNAFLWNLLKGSMSSIRDKFDHYHFKMSTMSTAAAAVAAGTSSTQTPTGPVEFMTNRVRHGDHMVLEGDIFSGVDLLEIYSNIVFRKTGDLHSKSKQFIKAYFNTATHPPCAIWHFSLRQTGASHKKWLQNIPGHVLESIIHFLLSLAGLGAIELETTSMEVENRGRFFLSLGDTDDQREATFATMKATRESLVQKFRQNVTDALNEVREMPYNTVTRQLMAPPRGKPLDNTNCVVTWRQYEMLIKRCEADPSKENLDAKHDLDQRLMLTNFYTPSRLQLQHPADDDDVEIDVEGGIKEEL